MARPRRNKRAKDADVTARALVVVIALLTLLDLFVWATLQHRPNVLSDWISDSGRASAAAAPPWTGDHGQGFSGNRAVSPEIHKAGSRTTPRTASSVD